MATDVWYNLDGCSRPIQDHVYKRYFSLVADLYTTSKVVLEKSATSHQ